MCLILILGSLTLVLSFQNCQKSQSSASAASTNCSTIDSAACLSANTTAQSLSLNLTDSILSLWPDNSSMNFQVQISMATDQAIVQNSTATCTLKLNAKWQEAKALYLNSGLCHYTYLRSAGNAYCMAYAMPYAKVTDSNKNEIEISLSICQQDFDNLCSYDDTANFKNLLQDLQTEFSQNQACD
ncbi:MAG: hypothetical protein ACXVBD_04255 [Pseudobdellovibrio sp.]